MSWLLPAYPWIKALHIVAVIAWMAGLLYLPRLFVYHAGEAPGSPLGAMFSVMERRLLRAIMTPAMVAVFAFGGLLAAMPGLVDWGRGWIYVKLALVLCLAALHGAMARWCRAFADGRNRHSQRFYRIVNEVPTVLMIGIVLLVVVRPF